MKQPLPPEMEYAPVAQLDRALDSDSKGRWFESSRAYQMNTTRISNFFVETRVVTYSESLILQGFPLFYVQPIHIRKHQNFKDVFIRQHHYMNTVFRYSYLDMLLQTLAVFCISAFDGGELHCKNGYIHPHSFESAAQKYIHAGRPPLF